MAKRPLVDNKISLTLTPEEVRQQLAQRVRAARLRRGWTQAVLGERSGVAAVTIKNFERTGQLTLSRLLLIARALEALEGFERLFEPPPAATLADLESTAPQRTRGKRRGSK